MAVVNAALRDALRDAGANPEVMDLSAPSLDRSLRVRLARVPKVLRGVAYLAIAKQLRGRTLYMSVSGGFGQLYDLFIVALGRLRGARVYLHHHSYAYLRTRSRLTSLLVRIAGKAAVHVVLSQGMSARLKSMYNVQRVVAISNAVFLPDNKKSCGGHVRRRLKTLGFISNISAEKGIFEFLDLIKAANDAGLSVRGKIAGPFEDMATQQRVLARMAELPAVEYVGPKYDGEKETFFRDIDVLVFPSRYVNEAEPLTLHEAMRHGIPVIAYGRGCIPEIVGSDCGAVVDPGENFVLPALAQIELWQKDAAGFEHASRAATARFWKTYAESEARWRALLAEVGGHTVTPITPRSEKGDEVVEKSR